MDVGVRELKAKLSEYVARAAKGEVIRVTDRGQPRAILAPLRETSSLEAGVDEGWIAAPEPRERARLVRKRVRANRSTSSVLSSDRGR